MSLNSHRLLDAILFVHFEGSKHLLGGSLESFSESMREVNAELPLPLQTRLFCDDLSVVKRMEANGKRLRRYQDDRDPNRMPAELALLFVATLKAKAPEAGLQCASEICRALGSLYVPLPNTLAGADMANLARVSKEFGEFCLSWAPMVADGQINEADEQHIAEATRQTEDLIAAAFAAKAQLEDLSRRIAASRIGRANGN